ncbi:MAG: L-aspartate oxidase, partial [Clostridia bacterium]|nr:L-aspartate oxidase [Clostridia bacterium]
MLPRYITNFDTQELPWRVCDYLVIGSGIAGLYSALKASAHGRVILLTKKKVADSNTEYAQGGIAAAIDEDDSPDLHLEDTMEAGAGLCNMEAVEVLVNEGPQRVKELIELGANFDRIGNELALTREGAHSRRRILHARGDATGEEIRRALAAQIRQEALVEVKENCFVVDLLTIHNRCLGALVMDSEGRLEVYYSKVVILATGGAGQLYKNTTNPEVATGDGMAFAYRAGVELMDMEFVQFHPTALALDGAPSFLISEAVRGEGAVLRNGRGERFMTNYHPLAELAPRDIVTRAIIKEMESTGSSRTYLDLTHLDEGLVSRRFPNISATCARYGLDLAKEWISVAPSAHYMMGGVRTSLYGETNITGFYACGEAACLGVHGANRLASNSLLDGLVFGDRIIRRSLDYVKEQQEPQPVDLHYDKLLSPLQLDTGEIKGRIQDLMWDKVGIIRSGEGIQQALSCFIEMGDLHFHQSMGVE